MPGSAPIPPPSSTLVWSGRDRCASLPKTHKEKPSRNVNYLATWISLILERDHGVNLRRPARRQETGEHCDRSEKHGYA
jgi:hypothetical protein